VNSWFQTFAFKCNLYRCSEGQALPLAVDAIHERDLIAVGLHTCNPVDP
jgi:hypothetical protein